MINFYAEMKNGILTLSVEKRSFILSMNDIKNLPSYKLAPVEFQDDFDGTVFGSKSKGSMGKAQTKVKTINSPFANITNFNEAKDSFEEEQNTYVSPLKPISVKLEKEVLYQPPSTQNRYYEPTNKDETDTLIA